MSPPSRAPQTDPGQLTLSHLPPQARERADPEGEASSQFPTFGREAEVNPEAATQLPGKAFLSDRSDLYHPSSPKKTCWPRIPNYEILDELGRGGMGVVYLARQVGLDRIVALKMISDRALVDPDLRQRFQTEAQAVARLQHPHIVQIFEIGQADLGPFFSLEYVSGGDLSQLLTGQPLEPGRSAELIEQAARAVHAAHQQGILHRDLKPANILLTSDGQPKITDFGLAKDLQGPADGNASTQAGIVLGTPRYMAPEQTCSSRNLGPAVDVYALGVILYEMLTGRTPFQGDSVLETLEQIRRQDPIPLRRLRPRLSRDLETIVLKCLEKDSAKRYRSAEELADELKRWSHGEPIRARPLGPIGRSCRWAGRHPTVAALLALLVLTFVLGLTGVTAALVYAVEGWRTAEANAWEARRSGDQALQQQHRAEEKETEARQAQVTSEQRRQQAEHHLYFSCIARARLEWQLAQCDRAAAQLESALPSGPQGPAEDQPGTRSGGAMPGWEYYYLKGLLHADLYTLGLKHNSAIKTLVFSRDGRRFLTAGINLNDRTRRGECVVWQTGEYRSAPGWGHRFPIRSMDFLAEGDRVAWRSEDGTVFLTQPDPHQVVWRKKDDYAAVICSQPHSPGARAVWAVRVPSGARPALHELDPETGTVRRELPLEAPSHTHSPLAFHPNGFWLAVNQSTQVQMIDLRTGQTVQVFTQPHLNSTSNVAISLDGRYLAVGAGTQAVVWETTTGRLHYTLSGHTGTVSGVAFHPDSTQLATASADTTVRTWTVADGREKAVLIGHRGRVTCVSYHPEGRLLFSASEQPAAIKIWDLSRAPESLAIEPVSEGRSQPHEAIAFSPDSQRLLRLGTGKTPNLQIANAGSGRTVSQGSLPLAQEWLVPSLRAAFARQLSPGGRQHVVLVSRENPTVVEVREAETGQLVRSFPPLGRPVLQVAISADGQRVAAAGNDWRQGDLNREIVVWNVASAEPCLRLEAKAISFRTLGKGGKPHGSLALSPDGSCVAFDEYTSGPEPGQLTAQIRICQVETGQVLLDREQKPDWIQALTFSPKGTYLAILGIGSNPKLGGITVIDRATGKPLHSRPLDGPRLLHDLAFSPDETRLAGTDRDQVVLYDVATGQEILTLRNGPQRTNDPGFNPRVVWSPDGRRLAAVAWNGTVNVWSAPVGLSVQQHQEELRQQAAARSR